MRRTAINTVELSGAGWHYQRMLPNTIAAHQGLRGLALGDAFGETWFFKPAGPCSTAMTRQNLTQS